MSSSVPFPSEWPKRNQSLYEPIRSLGKGGFGSVYLARPKDTSSVYPFIAIKAIHSPNSTRIVTKTEFGYAKREIAVLMEVSHPNIVQLYSVIVEGPSDSQVVDIKDDSLTKEGISSTEFVVKTLQGLQLQTINKCCLVLSYHDGPTIQQLLDHGGALGYPLARELAKQLLQAVGYLHSRAVIHRDLKPDNCIVSGTNLNDALCWSDSIDAEDAVRHNKWHLTLIDFGFARPLHPDDIHVDVGLRNLSYSLDLTSNNNNASIQKDLLLMSVDKPLEAMSHLEHHPVTNNLNSKESKRTADTKESISHHRVEDLSALGNRHFAAPEMLQNVRKFTRRLSSSSMANSQSRHNHSNSTESSKAKDAPIADTSLSSSLENTSLRKRSSITNLLTLVSLRRHASKTHNTPLSEHVSTYGMVVDAYSVGATLRYMVTGCPPHVSTSAYIAEQKNPLNAIGSLFHRKSKSASETNPPRKKQYRYQQDLPEEVRFLVLGLTHFDPQKRTSVRTALKSKWFGGEESKNEGIEPVTFLTCVMEGFV